MKPKRAKGDAEDEKHPTRKKKSSPPAARRRRRPPERRQVDARQRPAREDRMIPAPSRLDARCGVLRFHLGRPPHSPLRHRRPAPQSQIEELAEKLSASDSVRAIRFAEVVVLLLDAERPLEHQISPSAIVVTDEGRAFVIALNKWDLVEDKQNFLRDLIAKVEISLAQVPGVAVVPISQPAKRVSTSS